MNKLFIRNFNAVVDRGLITPKTTKYDFFDKMQEEFKEILESCDVNIPKLSDHEAEEVTDLLTVCSCILIWSGRDPEKEQLKIALKNESRCKK